MGSLQVPTPRPKRSVADDVKTPPDAAPPYTDAIVSLEAIATLLALSLGLVYWFCLRPRRSSSNVNTSINREPSTKPRDERYRAFVESEVTAHSAVLFVASGGHADSFRSLYDALAVKLHVVDLARTAGGGHVLEALHQQYPEAGGEKELLFVNQKLLGGQQRVRNLLLNGERAALGSSCDWSHVRVDVKTDAGFMVLGPQNGFECVKDVGENKDVAAQLEARPLYTAKELRDFDVTTLVRSPVPTALRSRNQPRRSKLLVCHDMKGGYQDDRFKQGCNDFDAYRFYQWDLVDLFVYFGHALVCPPPVGWITAGHRHGTRVLGTFLTEGDQGTVLCEEIFKDVHSAETFASKLVAIAWHGGFDGWLINIENSVPADFVASIDVFLRILRKGLQLQNPQALVVWYGSLSRLGKRKAHVRLDEASVDFFNNVDAFYVDYGWVSDDAKFSAAFNLDRRYDIYMGIDVFGRHNMLGGGKMNCGEPLRLAWNSGVSAALFAPGWTHECYQHEEQEDFIVVENRFWESVRASWKERSPCYDALGGQNCLYSAFNIGRGAGVWTDGRRVGEPTWSNMSELDLQPSQTLHVGHIVSTATGSVKGVISHDMAFQGGSSVQLQ
ncbi:hypothetical protein PHYBOEH_001273, partial [Phytophthora boehmeriae]